MARIFGAGLLSDIFFIAYRIPNLLRSFLGEGALSAAFVPVFAEDLHKNKQQALRTLESVSGLLLITTIILSVLGIIFADQIIILIAPGYLLDSREFNLCVSLVRITFPYIIFVSIIALINGALNNLKIYGASPLAQIAMNIVLIIGSLVASIYHPEQGIKILSATVILGGIVQVLIQFPALKKAGLLIQPAKTLLTKSSKKIMFLMLPALFGSAIYQIGVFINTMLASLLPAGSISWLFYADRISQLPIGILTIALASVLLPSLSASDAKGDKKQFAGDLNNSLRYISFLIIPTAFALLALAVPITRLVFERGSFNILDTMQTAKAIMAISFGLWGISCYTIISRAFLAQKDTLTPSLLGIASLIINICIALLTMGPVTPGKSYFWSSIQTYLYSIFPQVNLTHSGLALASGLSVTIILFPAILLLQRKSAWCLAPFLTAVYKSFFAATGMYIVLVVIKNLIFSPLYILLISAPVSILIYSGILFFLKSQEIQETFSLIKRLIKQNERKSNY